MISCLVGTIDPVLRPVSASLKINFVREPAQTDVDRIAQPLIAGLEVLERLCQTSR